MRIKEIEILKEYYGMSKIKELCDKNSIILDKWGDIEGRTKDMIAFYKDVEREVNNLK